jgi:hypothetical protein
MFVTGKISLYLLSPFFPRQLPSAPRRRLLRDAFFSKCWYPYQGKFVRDEDIRPSEPALPQYYTLSPNYPNDRNGREVARGFTFTSSAPIFRS